MTSWIRVAVRVVVPALACWATAACSGTSAGHAASIDAGEPAVDGSRDGARTDARGADARAETGAHDSSTHDGSGDARAAEAGTEAGVADSSSTDSSSEPCGIKASCTESADDTCVGLTKNAGLSKFGLRMAELDLSLPAGLTTGVVNATVSGAAVLDLPACNLNGSGTFSWLLELDTTAMTLKTGGARPVADPTLGYSFDDEMITLGATTFNVQPITYTGVLPDASGKFATTTGMDLIMPVFLDAAGTSSLLLPLRQTILSGTISSNDDCIGSYNAAGLDPANSCNPDSTHPSFIDAASVSAFITLEDADTVIVSAVDQSLCVLLSGNAMMYGATNAMGVTTCKRDASNDIVYQGHWCSTTNMAATATCADAEQLVGSFAASSVKILN